MLSLDIGEYETRVFFFHLYKNKFFYCTIKLSTHLVDFKNRTLFDFGICYR